MCGAGIRFGQAQALWYRPLNEGMARPYERATLLTAGSGLDDAPLAEDPGGAVKVDDNYVTWKEKQTSMIRPYIKRI